MGLHSDRWDDGARGLPPLCRLVAPRGHPRPVRVGRATTIRDMPHDSQPGSAPGRVFRRSLDPDLPVAVAGHESTIVDAAGREYLDASGGAIVVNVGHGRQSIADAI